MAITGDVVKEYLEKFKDTPSLTLARLIYKENKLLFNSVEHARTIVRSYKGASGDVLRKKFKDRRYFREFSKDLFNPFKLPESDEKEFDPFVVPKNNNRILVLSDIHIPYHSISAVTAALQYGKDHEINTIILNGDIIDFHQLSSFIKDPRNRHFKEEKEMAIQFFKSLRDNFKTQNIYYKLGNHEERYENYMKVRAPELFGDTQFELDVILQLESFGVEIIKEKRTVKAGKLNVVHGHELKGGIIAPVNPARGLFLRTNTNCIAGHWHRSSEHVDPNINGEIIGCWSTGCLCELHPDYMPNNKWNHGAADISLNSDGSFFVNNFKIIDGKVLSL